MSQWTASVPAAGRITRIGGSSFIRGPGRHGDEAELDFLAGLATAMAAPIADVGGLLADALMPASPWDGYG